MIRALAFCAVICAVISAVGAASGQTVAPRIIADTTSDSEPTIALADGAPTSACGKKECPAPSGETTSDKPLDDHALLRQKLAEMNCLQSEIESLRVATGTPQQILVKMKVVEVSRTKMRKLGFNFATLRGGKQNATPKPYSPPNGAKGEGVEFGTIDDSTAVVGLIEHLQNNNIGKVLAEPHLVVTCGRPALFNVGGEVPLPTLPGSNQAVEFKQFGTQVDVLAIAQGDDRVRLEIRARVSELDHSHDLQVGNVRVPGLQVRQIDTGFNLKFGQTGVMSGLVQQRVETIKKGNKVSDEVNDIELLFLVTPQSVDSADGSVFKVPVVSKDSTEIHTANSDSEVRPGERSLRVTRPSRPR